MSKTQSERQEDPAMEDDVATDNEREEPDIEKELFEEELRIDGICGVY